jgi:tetratricopeptide (TPR) repeat protein
VAWALGVVNVGSGIRWTDALATLDAFEVERGNIDEAIRWLDESGRTEAFVQLVSAASAFWLAGHHLSHARPWLNRAVDMQVMSPSPDAARLLRNTASVEHQLGASARAFELIDRSVSDWALVGNDAGRADALRLRGTFLLDQGEFEGARTTLAESVALARAVGDEETRRRCLVDLARIALNEGDNLGAEALYHELLEACTVAGDYFGVGIAHGNLAFVLVVRGEVASAEREAREAVRFFTEIGDTEYLGWSLSNLAGVLTEAGRLEDALPIARQALGMAWEIGGVEDVAASIETLSGIASGSHDAQRAVRLMSAAQRIRAEAGRPIMGPERVRLTDRFERAREALGDDFVSTVAAATALSVEVIVRGELSAL